MTNSEKELSLVIPVFNESSHIIDSLKKIKEQIKEVTLDYEIIIVDDGSTDDTWHKLCDNLKFLSNMYLIKLSRNFGKEAALAAGLEHANGKAVIIMDADLQHPPSLISKIVNTWRLGEVSIVEFSNQIIYSS